MRISIATRLKPFSHQFGTLCPIPRSDGYICAYPTLIQLVHPSGNVEIRLQLTGPVRQFTVQLDLERDWVVVFGQAKEGVFSLRFQATPKGVILLGDRLPSAGIGIQSPCFPDALLLLKQSIHIPLAVSYMERDRWERLSLGIHRKQDWDLVWRRMDPKEILPFLFALGQTIPSQKRALLIGSARLLGTSDIPTFLKVAFSHLLVPRLFDDQYQGIVPEEGAGEDPSFLFPHSVKWIRSLFFTQNGREIELLPTNLFDAGRMTEVHAEGVGRWDLEWRSSQLRRCRFECQSGDPFQLHLPQGLQTFRIRTNRAETNRAEKEKRWNGKEPLCLQEGTIYLFDRFQS